MKEFVGSGYLYIALCVICSCILLVGFFAWAFFFIKHVTKSKESNLQKMYGRKKKDSEKEKEITRRLVISGVLLGVYAVFYFVFI